METNRSTKCRYSFHLLSLFELFVETFNKYARVLNVVNSKIKKVPFVCKSEQGIEKFALHS